MDTRNSCYTYFTIVGEFDPDAVTTLLGLTPDSVCRIGEIRRNGRPSKAARWSFGHCDEYDPHVENQMRKTISALRDKVDLLNRIRRENRVSFYLEVVPSVYTDDISPCLAPSLDVMEFCVATGTELDIDLYVYRS